MAKPTPPSGQQPVGTYGSRRATPVLSTAELEIYMRQMAEFEEQTPPLQREISARLTRVPTRPAPPTLTALYSGRMMQEIEGLEGALGDRAIVQEVVHALDPLVTRHAPAVELLDTLHELTEGTDDLRRRRRLWDVAVAALQAVVEGMLVDVDDSLFDEDQALALGRYLGRYLDKVISPAVRVTFVRTLRAFLGRDDVTFAAKHRTVQAFVFALVSHLQGSGEAPTVLGSDAAQRAFLGTGIILPRAADRSLSAFTRVYPSGDSTLYDHFRANEGGSEQAQEALALLRESQHLGLVPADLDGFDADAFARLCKGTFIRMYRIIKLESDRYMQVLLFKTWNEILAPQLLVIGDLLLPDSPFLLPPSR